MQNTTFYTQHVQDKKFQLESTTNKSYHNLNLENWDRLKDRYSSYIDDNITGQKLIIFSQGSEEAEWLEKQILPDLKKYTGLDHKIKVAILGGLCSGNILHEHIDGHYPPKKNSSVWSLNIPIKNYDNFKMLWYDGEYIPEVRETAPNTTSLFVADEMQHLRPKWTGIRNLKDSVIINSPTIVQINIPHQVINYSNKTRVVLAIRLTPDIKIL